MSRIEEEQKLERVNQARRNPYQQYQAYLEKLDNDDEIFSHSVGEMRGKKLKRLDSAEVGLNTLFNHFLNKAI